MTIGNYTCTLLTGDSDSDDYIELEDHTSAEDCVRKCVEMKKTNPRVNGVSISSFDATECWCNLRMVGVDGDEDYKSCFLLTDDGK